MLRAGFQAGVAADAAVLDHCTCGLQLQAFRVVAPGAAQRAALEEDGGADARPVLGGEALQVQDGAGERCDAVSHIVHLHLVAFAGDDLVLQFLADGGEVGVVAGDAHQQVAVILGVLLRVAQHVGVEHVDLQGAAAVLDVAAQEGLELCRGAPGRAGWTG